MCMFMMSQDPGSKIPEECEKYYPTGANTFITTTESTMSRTPTDNVPKTTQIDLNVTPTQFEPEKTASNPTTYTEMTSKTTSTPTQTTSTPTKTTTTPTTKTKAILAADWEEILAQWIKQ